MKRCLMVLLAAAACVVGRPALAHHSFAATYLETQTVTIEGETVTSCFMVMPPEVGGGLKLSQALARYTWDGESGVGMVERSNTDDQIA